jgi:hypothetical protein
MVGNHNSGRKKSTDSEYYRMGKKTFYIKQKKNKTGTWVDDPIFQWFKRKHGSLWQAQVRQWMKLDVESYKREKFWRCVKCPNTGLLGNYISRKQPRCHQCGAWKNEITRLRYEG